MKQELSKLSPYLPYKLICQYRDAEDMRYELVTSNIIETKGHREYGRIGIEVLLNDNNFKPILRPLETITDEFEVNGEMINIFDKVSFTFLDFQMYEDDLITNISYKDINILLSYHFDLFDLIINNLAIKK
jgi:hypothetical protein